MDMSYEPVTFKEINETIKALGNFIVCVCQDSEKHNATAEELRALPAVAEVYFRSIKHYD